MAIDYSLLKFAKGKPRALATHTKAVALSAALRKAYDKVDARDRKVCQVTGKPLVVDHGNPKLALTRHHLDERSGHKDRRHDPDNILTVSAAVHTFMQSGALLAVDKRGRETTSVKRIAAFKWNPRMVEPGKAPFRIVAKPGRL